MLACLVLPRTFSFVQLYRRIYISYRYQYRTLLLADGCTAQVRMIDTTKVRIRFQNEKEVLGYCTKRTVRRLGLGFVVKHTQYQVPVRGTKKCIYVF